jgi:acyl-CoA synthetase (AMP-forming)/AMP-acid ligase II
MKTTLNIASHLPAMAELAPQRAALVFPDARGGWKTMTFSELETASNRLAHGFQALGVQRGQRVVVFVPPGPAFFPIVFAIFKVGAVLVAIDPGIERTALLACLNEVRPDVFIGVPRAHLARILFPKSFRSVTTSITVGKRWLWSGLRLEDVMARGNSAPFAMTEPAPHETAAILFTSGSTGIPKGAVYSHEIFDAQVRLIRNEYGIEPGEIDLATFPLFALFDPALGMTAVLPEMDFRFPARASPQKIVHALTEHRCTNMFGSPALIDNLSRYASDQGLSFPFLRRVLSAGAPVRIDVLERMSGTLSDDAQVFTPFGATESLPVASIGSREVLRETRLGSKEGRGICVGRPNADVELRIIKITDEPIERWSDAWLVAPGAVGEITVAGPMVTREYWARPEQTRLSKIQDGARVVHRMGDLGFMDDQGRLWMCGRKSHRVETPEGPLFTVPIEEVINTHPAVRRSALVGVGARGQQIPVVLLELETPLTRRPEVVISEVERLASQHEVTRRCLEFAVYPGSFPVDRRHNAKIEREKLARWALVRGLGRKTSGHQREAPHQNSEASI